MIADEEEKSTAQFVPLTQLRGNLLTYHWWSDGITPDTSQAGC